MLPKTTTKQPLESKTLKGNHAKWQLTKLISEANACFYLIQQPTELYKDFLKCEKTGERLSFKIFAMN